MSVFQNKDGKPVLLAMVKAIQDNKAYLGEVMTRSAERASRMAMRTMSKVHRKVGLAAYKL